LRSLPTAYEDAAHAAVEQWVHRGLEIAADNADAGSAYFALESRTSVRILQASSTAAVLADVQGLLRKYVQMLSGRPVSIRAASGFQLRSPLEEFPLEDEVALPLKVDVFGTHEDNVRVYRFLAAQLAGRRECATYAADLPAAAADGLLHFLRAPGQPGLLEDLFLVTEGFRVAAAQARSYPGLAREQRGAAERCQLANVADEVRYLAVRMHSMFEDPCRPEHERECKCEERQTLRYEAVRLLCKLTIEILSCWAHEWLPIARRSALDNLDLRRHALRRVCSAASPVPPRGCVAMNRSVDA